MKENVFIKFISSIPIILVVLYFIPFLGICLLIFRYFVYSNKKRISTPITILIVGLLILVPKILSNILKFAKIKIDTIPYLNDIVTADLYNINFMKYSKLLICTGIIFLILSFIVKRIFDKVSNKVNTGIKDYIARNEQRDAEISQKNDLIMKEKREKAKNTSYVRCPYCGSDNIMSEKTGTCAYCRRTIENKNYHS